MKASLQLNISQHLALTPQLQQAIRLLQLSTIDLNTEIQQALESNPMLELQGDENHNITVIKKADIPINTNEMSRDTSDVTHYASISSNNYFGKSANNYNYENFYGTTTDLSEHLKWQLNLTPMSDIDKVIALTLIDATGEDGLLTQTLKELQHTLTNLNIETTLNEIESVRHLLLRFDPIGCVAISIEETLLVQLEQCTKENNADTHLCKRLIQSDLITLGQKNYRQILSKYRIKEITLSKALTIIQSLSPKPGLAINQFNVEYIIPDVVAKKVDSKWVIKLNQEAIPKLKINVDYASLIKRADSSSGNLFLKNNLQEAKWLLKSIKSRQETLYRVASAIIEHQIAFLEHGEEAMKPLTLNDIAEKLELHESTISRVTTQKYIHTPRGVFELKYFFSSHLDTQNGGECSSTAIRALIKKLVSSENSMHPLSDNKIAKIIQKHGINVARRTIAKYREILGIPPSNKRKSIVVENQA